MKEQGQNQDLESLRADIDDAAAWDEAVTDVPKVARRRRHVVVSVRLTPEELARVGSGAQKRGLPISSFLRQAALELSEDEPVSVPVSVQENGRDINVTWLPLAHGVPA